MTWLYGACVCALLMSGCAEQGEEHIAAHALRDAKSALPRAVGSPSSTLHKPATPLPIMDVLEPDAAALAIHVRAPLPSALREEHRDRIKRSPLPVLLPAAMTEAQFERALVTTGPHWYALSSTQGGVTVYVQGARTRIEHPQLELDTAGEALSARPYLLSRTHQIVTISFERFGLPYHMDVECAAPTTDERCTQDDYALSLYDSLTHMTPAQKTTTGGVQ